MPIEIREVHHVHHFHHHHHHYHKISEADAKALVEAQFKKEHHKFNQTSQPEDTTGKSDDEAPTTTTTKKAKCGGKTKAGKPCKKNATKNGRCHLHPDDVMSAAKKQCAYIRPSGVQCKNGTDHVSGKCAAHQTDPAAKPQCVGITKAKVQCKHHTDHASGLCGQHLKIMLSAQVTDA